MSHERTETPDLERFRISRDYVADRSSLPLEEHQPDFENIIKLVARFVPVTPTTDIFEIGAGLGWFEVLCAKRGLSCSAIEFNPVIRDTALALARREGVEVDIAFGDIETTDIGHERFDVIIATSVFEHVRNYGRGFARVYDALRPGGVFYFYSTNKFSLRSGEYTDFPLYGWFPYAMRQRIRVSQQGAGIVESSGIDFNQFTYWGLARHFRSLGFTRVLDRVDYLDPADRSARTRTRTLGLLAARRLPPIRLAARAFAPGNHFICVK